MTESAPQVRIALIGMPAWDIQMPFHSLVAVAGVALHAGAAVDIHDLNIDLYRRLDDAERRTWTEDMNSSWFGEELPRRIWSKYEPWMHQQLDKALAASPTLIAFSVNMATRFFSIAAAKYLKARRPEIPIMFGGVDCFPGEESFQLLSPEPGWHCDLICQGESEIPFPKFLEEFRETGDWKTSIPGFAYYDNGKFVNTGVPELHDLKAFLPDPPFHLFDLGKYTNPGTLPFFFTRGCPYKCEFCSETVNYRNFRCKDAAAAFDELRRTVDVARKYAARPTLLFSDSIFNAKVKEFEKLMDLIIENNVEVTMGAQGHIHPLMSNDYLRKMKRSGFTSVFWGIETGSQQVVELMRKAYMVRDARRILSECSRIGIHQNIPLLVGFPGESPENVAETIEFIFAYQDLPEIYFHLPCHVIVRKNTPLKMDPERFALATLEDYEWCIADGTNTLPIRIARRYVMRQAHSNRQLSMDGLVDTEEILNISLNEPNLAQDLLRLLYGIAQRAGAIALLEESINQRMGVREGNPVDSWMRMDKDSPEGRRAVSELVLQSLRDLRAAVGAPELRAAVVEGEGLPERHFPRLDLSLETHSAI